MDSTQDIIVKLLTNIGSRKEVEQYLRHYASVDSQKLAVVKVSGSVLHRSLDSLASSLSFLQRVGLHPIVIHGAGPQLNQAVVEAGFSVERIDGQRVTPPEILEITRRVFQRENLLLADALESYGTRARPILSGVFQARRVADSRLGLTGEVVAVDGAAIKSSIAMGHLPILAPLGETPDGQILNVNADVATRELALSFQSHKIIFLTETGGLLDGDGNIVSALSLDEDYDDLMRREWVHSGMRFKLEQINALLRQLPRSSSVSITSPDHLAKELFTHRGAGTLVRVGERIDRHDDFAAIDTVRLRALLEACFGRQLDDQYFTAKKPYAVYLADSYRATAIFTREEAMPYLDKFATTAEAQGEGIGGSIWKRIRRDIPRFFWRSRAANPVNDWYADKADGSYKTDTWAVYWCGTHSFPEIQACIERALAIPATLHGPIRGQP
jgi:bifunctional N-acetylglutamate synthase/kinase